MERLKNLKWENGQNCAEALKQERGGTPHPSFNKNTLPHNFTTILIVIHLLVGIHIKSSILSCQEIELYSVCH